MNKLFPPYELTLELKELGFNERCLKLYNKDKSLGTSIIERSNTFKYHHKNFSCTAPTWQQVFDWFEDNHNLSSYIRKISTHPEHISYYWKIHNLKAVRGEEILSYSGFSKSRLDCRITCLKKLIVLVKTL